MLKVAERSPASAPKRESIYQPEQSGLIFPTIPSFATPAEERRHRKERVAAACRAFALYGFDYGFAGHISVRDPEFPNLYWTNPMAVPFSQVQVSNLILVNHEGEVVEGRHAVNRAGFILHASVHEANPDIVAMCHAHTVYGTAWAATGRLLDPISQDACCFYECHAVVNDEGGAVAVKEGQGAGVVEAFAKNRAILHQNHGILTGSRHSVDDACFWFIALERCCQIQLMLEASGTKPPFVTPERARYSREHVGSDFIGWLHFQPIYQQLVKEQPDLLE
jgi:ribulose-5-phosphate 4-epimerase/fuculose-1-phosphate aldolase